jgi:hypothetical protein
MPTRQLAFAVRTLCCCAALLALALACTTARPPAEAEKSPETLLQLARVHLEGLGVPEPSRKV